MKDWNETRSIIAKWSRYLLFNGIFATSIYFGLFTDGWWTDGAANLALVIGWATGIFGAMILLGIELSKRPGADDDYIEMLARQEPSVIPFWFDLTFDLIVTVAFIWSGYIVLSLFYIISIIALKAVRDVPKNMVLSRLKSQKS